MAWAIRALRGQALLYDVGSPMLAALLLSIAANVTYSGPVDRLENVLAALSDLTGERLRASPRLADVPVYLRCENRPAQEVRDRLAQTLGARWVSEGGALYLRREPRDEEADRKADVAAEATRIARSLQAGSNDAEWKPGDADAYAAELVALVRRQDPEKGWEQYSDWSERSPGDRAARRILRAMDPELLASLPPNERVVFSNRPNPLQRPMPEGWLAPARQAVVEREEVGQALKRLKFDEIEKPWTGSEQRFWMESAEPLDRIVLAVQRDMSQNRLKINLFLLDASGREILRGRPYLSLTAPERRSDGGWSALLPKDGTIEIPWAPERAARRSLLQLDDSDFSKPNPPPLSPKGRELALALGQIEPLGYLATDPLRRILGDGPTVALVPDVFAFFMAEPKEGKWPVAQLGYLDNEVRVGQADGWTTLTPAFPGRYYQNRLPRNAMGEVVRIVAEQDPLTLEDRARIAFLAAGADPDYLLMFLLMRLKGQEALEIITGRDAAALRFYGSLVEQERLAAGAGVRLADLSRGAQECAHAFLFGDPPPLIGPVYTSDLPGGLEAELTERLPEGMPSGASVKITPGESQTLAVEWGPEGSPLSRHTAESLGRNRYFATRPDVFPWAKPRPAPAPVYRLAQRREVMLQFVLRPDLIAWNSLDDVRYGATKPVPFAELPADFRAEVARAFAAAKQQFKDAKPGQYSSPPLVIPPR